MQREPRVFICPSLPLRPREILKAVKRDTHTAPTCSPSLCTAIPAPKAASNNHLPLSSIRPVCGNLGSSARPAVRSSALAAAPSPQIRHFSGTLPANSTPRVNNDPRMATTPFIKSHASSLVPSPSLSLVAHRASDQLCKPESGNGAKRHGETLQGRQQKRR